MVLVEDTNLNFAIYNSVAVEDVQFSYKGVQKSRFSCTIGAYEGNFGIHINFQIDLANNDILPIITDFTISDSKNWPVELWRSWEFEYIVWFFKGLFFHSLLDLLDHLNSGLSKSSSLGIGTESSDEILMMGNFVELRLSQSLSLKGLFFLNLHESVEVTFIISQFQILELDDFIDGGVQEISSMGNNYNSGIIKVLDVLLEPDQSFEI